jgi:hypothetical protein
MKKLSIAFCIVVLVALTGCQSAPVEPSVGSNPAITIQVTKPAETTQAALPASQTSPPAAGATSYPAPAQTSIPYPAGTTESSNSPYPAGANPPAPTLTIEPFVFKTSAPGKITLRGIVVVTDIINMPPDLNDAVFLVPMAESGSGPVSIPQFRKGEVPQAEVDERTGEFVLTDIQPGIYAVVILVKNGAQIPARYMEKGNFVILTLTSADIDKTLDLGYLVYP